MMRVFGKLVVGAAMFGGFVIGAHVAQATPTLTTLQSATTGAVAATDFTTNLTVFKFNPALGTLTDVYLTLNGTVVADLSAESKDAAPATITLLSKATETLKTGGGLSLAQALPANSVIFNAAAYDHVLDFGGTSGTTVTGLTGTAATGQLDITGATTSVAVPGGSPLSVSGSAILSAFTGVGAADIMTLTLGAAGNSSATGAGNLVSSISTNAAGNITVQYGYTPAPVPEPASMTLLGAGLLGLGAISHRRSKKA